MSPARVVVGSLRRSVGRVRMTSEDDEWMTLTMTRPEKKDV